MNNFTSKFRNRKIGPKFTEIINRDIGAQQFKPYLYEDEINFDRLRMYRLNRVIEQIKKMKLVCFLIQSLFVLQLIVHT